MNINATLIGQVIFVFAIFMAVLCYFIAKKKNERPLLSAVVGFVTSLVPVVAIIYLVILMAKPDRKD